MEFNRPIGRKEKRRVSDVQLVLGGLSIPEAQVVIEPVEPVTAPPELVTT